MNFLVPTKHPRANEAVGLVLFTLTALLLLSLLSYHPTDPSFNTSRNQPARRHCGKPRGRVWLDTR